MQKCMTVLKIKKALKLAVCTHSTQTIQTIPNSFYMKFILLMQKFRILNSRVLQDGYVEAATQVDRTMQVDARTQTGTSNFSADIGIGLGINECSGLDLTFTCK